MRDNLDELSRTLPNINRLLWNLALHKWFTYRLSEDIIVLRDVPEELSRTTV